MQEDIFQFIENCFTKYNKVDSSVQLKNIYMVNKFLSLNMGTFYMADKANRLASRLPSWAVACYLHYSIDKKRNPPKIVYPKKLIESKWPKELLTKIGTVFNCSFKHAEQIIMILSRTDENFAQQFGIEKGGKIGKN